MAKMGTRKVEVWDKKKFARTKDPHTQAAIMNQFENYECPKCGKKGYPEIGEFRATPSGALGRLYNVQSERFTYISCKRCKFTEIYKTESSQLGNLLDFLFGH